MNARTQELLFRVGLYAALGFVAYKFVLPKIGDLLNEKFNPTSDKNLAYQGTNSLVQQLTNDPNATVGTALYDLFHRDPLTPYQVLQVKFSDGTTRGVGNITIRPDGTVKMQDGVWKVARTSGGQYFAVR